jgi:phosphate starvation-inducible protein PhoH
MRNNKQSNRFLQRGFRRKVKSSFTHKGDTMAKKKTKTVTKQPTVPVLPKLNYIEPKTTAQKRVFDSYARGKNLVLHGVPGSGKTFIALYLALESVITGEAPKPIVIVRSTVPVRDLGHLPGNIQQKIEAYESPYSGIVSELTDKSYTWMKQNNYIEFCPTSFLRGTTYKDCIIIVDECQNMSDQELHTIMTRVGEGSRIILCGDFKQKDYMKETSGINSLLKITKRMKSFDIVEFKKEDIVRSGFVREYIISRLYLEETNELN